MIDVPKPVSSRDRPRLRRASRWRRALGLIGLCLAGLLLLSTNQMWAAGYWLQPTRESRLAAFDRLWSIMRDQYPYFDVKGADWNDARDRYRPRVAAAGDDQVFFVLLAEMLGELNDGHTGVMSPYPDVACFGATREVEGLALVSVVGPSATAHGLARGEIVTAVDGRDVEDALLALDPRLRTGSTPAARRGAAFEHLLCGPADHPLAVEVVGTAGQPRTLTLRAATTPAGPAPSATAAIRSERLAGGLGLIAVNRLYDDDGGDLVAAFDAALARLSDAPGLILDLRGNGGGSSGIGDAIAGRFVPNALRYGREHYRLRLPFRGWLLSHDYVVQPRGPRYTGPLVVIIDTGVASSAEQLVAALVDGAGARTVGRATAGECGNPMRLDLRGGWVRFSTGDFRRSNGQPIEGVGLSPDDMVVWRLDDWRTGRDPDLATAVALLTP